MKSNLSRYILAAEILAIVIFHAVKIKQEEKQPVETAFERFNKSIPLQKPAIGDQFGIEYMLLSLIK
jgi:hypothetical protein